MSVFSCKLYVRVYILDIFKVRMSSCTSTERKIQETADQPFSHKRCPPSCNRVVFIYRLLTKAIYISILTKWSSCSLRTQNNSTTGVYGWWRWRWVGETVNFSVLNMFHKFEVFQTELEWSSPSWCNRLNVFSHRAECHSFLILNLFSADILDFIEQKRLFLHPQRRRPVFRLPSVKWCWTWIKKIKIKRH